MTHGPREAFEVDAAGWESKVLPATDMLDWHTGRILDALWYLCLLCSSTSGRERVAPDDKYLIAACARVFS